MRGQIVRFAVAGVFGFVVDAGILYLALHAGTGPYVGRVISFLCAVFATWQINRRYTFRSTVKRSAWREWNEYLLAMAFGGVCNYGVYVLAFRLLPPMALAPFFAVAVGSIAGMFVNFCTAKMWVFRHARSDKA
ncbi:GtrA family protein [Paraburkholderia flava]|uniref:GtrA family protein n=1 Tax=Paraburkholderia flava TaxID=2547393 RepID=UPI001060D2BC|nr:GtrA family protein [Paraburkholderia flava]